MAYPKVTVGDNVKVKVNPNIRVCYVPSFLHEFEGEVWDFDDEHIWVVGETQSMNGKEYISGPHRYCWTDIEVEVI